MSTKHKKQKEKRIRQRTNKAIRHTPVTNRGHRSIGHKKGNNSFQ